MVALPDARKLVLSEAVAQATAAIDEVPELAAHDDLQFTARLLTAELVENVVRHAGGPPEQTCTLLIECSDDTLRVELSDGGLGFNPLPLLRHVEVGRGHYGIKLVNAMADCWGFRRTPSMCLWFELELVPGRRPWQGREAVRGERGPRGGS